MRHSISFTFASLFAVIGCSTYSATLGTSRDAGTDAGETGGSVSSTGGSSSSGNYESGQTSTV